MYMKPPQTDIALDWLKNAIQYIENPEKLADFFNQNLHKHFGCQLVVLYIQNQQQPEFYKSYPPQIGQTATDSTLSHVFFSNTTTTRIVDIAQPKSSVYVPLIYQKQKIGALLLYNIPPNKHHQQAIALLEELRLLVATTLKKSFSLQPITQPNKIPPKQKISDPIAAHQATNQELIAAYEELQVTTDALRETNTQLLQEKARAQTNELLIKEAYLQLEKTKQIAHENEIKYKAAFVTSPDAITLTSLDGRYIEVNQGFTKLTGYSRSEVIGQLSSDIDIWHNPEERHFVVAELHKNQIIENVEISFRKKNGVLIDALVSAKIIQINNQPTILLLAKDISERKQIQNQLLEAKEKAEQSELLLLKNYNELQVAEEELRATNEELYATTDALKQTNEELMASQEKTQRMNERFDLAMQATSDGVWDWNITTADIYFSPRWKAIVGYADHELPNDFSVWEKLTNPDDVQHALDVLQKLIDGQIDKYEVELTMQHKQGHRVKVLSRANIFKDTHGKARIVGTHTDITEQKKAEQKLIQSEERFRKLVENMPSGLAIYQAVNNGADFRFVNINREAERITNTTKKELIGHTLLEKFPNMGKSPLLGHLQKVFQTGKEVYLPAFYYKDAKREGWRENHIYKLHTGEVVAIFKDVTKLKEAEIELTQKSEEYQLINEELLQKNHQLLLAQTEIRESEARFKALHNASFGGIAIHDKGVILDCNKGLSEMTGFSLDELIGMDGLLLIAQSTRDFVKAQILSQTEKPYEARGVRKNGQEYPLQLEARNIPYKGKQVRVVEFRDISKWKEYEKQILNAKTIAEENELKFKSYVKNAPDGILIFNNQGNVLDANNEAELLLGYTLPQLKATNKPIPTPPSEYPKVTKAVQTLFETGRLVDKFLIQPHNGNTFHALVSAARISDKQTIMFVKNIDEIVRTEQELIWAKEKAEESERLKTAFLQNMSHEIRTPLNAISGFVGFLKKPNLSPQKRDSFISIIQNSSAQLVSVVSDLLTISSLETHQEKINISQVNINEILLELLAIFREQASQHNIHLYTKKSLAKEQACISTDKTKITQVLSNLLSNALKFTNQGKIEFGYSLKGEFLEFFVADTGIGIKTEMQTKIFDRFSQAGKEIQQNYGGTGLGLSISKGFVELLGGKIWVESQINQGATFRFTLPYKPTKNNAQKTNMNHEKQHKRTILVAEDEEFNFLFIEEVLLRLNVNILHAKNGREAINLFEQNPQICLVLMDIKMPQMPGDEAAKIIKKLNPNVPVLAQSAYALEQEIEAYSKLFDDYLVKPIKEELLIAKIKPYLRTWVEYKLLLFFSLTKPMVRYVFSNNRKQQLCQSLLN